MEGPEEENPDEGRLTLDQRTTPIGLFNYAHSFWGAGRALLLSDWRERETHPDSPAEFLYWHAIELFLKSFLLADGMTLKELRGRDYGHDLTALTSTALKRGLQLTSKDQEVISFMPTTADMIDLRYLKAGYRQVPEFFEIEATCISLYNLVAANLQNRGIRIGFHASETKRRLDDGPDERL